MREPLTWALNLVMVGEPGGGGARTEELGVFQVLPFQPSPGELPTAPEVRAPEARAQGLGEVRAWQSTLAPDWPRAQPPVFPPSCDLVPLSLKPLP